MLEGALIVFDLSLLEGREKSKRSRSKIEAIIINNLWENTGCYILCRYLRVISLSPALQHHTWCIWQKTEKESIYLNDSMFDMDSLFLFRKRDGMKINWKLCRLWRWISCLGRRLKIPPRNVSQKSLRFALYLSRLMDVNLQENRFRILWEFFYVVTTVFLRLWGSGIVLHH